MFPESIGFAGKHTFQKTELSMETRKIISGKWANLDLVDLVQKFT
jgi:hypothetical protein